VAAPKPKPKGPDPRERAMKAVQTLALDSILRGGDSAVAMISSNVVTVGQTIKGWTVTRITSTEVELAWQDQKYVLTISN
jgi:hypothetical protein